MPRPSLKNERKNEVLAAYVRTVSKHGISGATLEAVAEEASMTRPLVRHHLGNKDAMFDQLVCHVVEAFAIQTQQLSDALPDNDRVMALIEGLFGQADATSPDMIFVFAELTLKSVSDEGLAMKLAASVTEFEAAILTELMQEFPHVAEHACGAVAHGILALYFNSISLAPLGLETSNARRAADVLVQSLNTER